MHLAEPLKVENSTDTHNAVSRCATPGCDRTRGLGYDSLSPARVGGAAADASRWKAVLVNRLLLPLPSDAPGCGNVGSESSAGRMPSGRFPSLG